jgi:hypothetical protein
VGSAHIIPPKGISVISADTTMEGDTIMPYVVRNAEGRVIAAAEMPLDAKAECVGPDDPELLAFFGRAVSGGDRFVASDFALIRVIEDLAEVMLRKGLLALTDLPAGAQDKLLGRRALRGWLTDVSGLVDGDFGKII